MNRILVSLNALILMVFFSACGKKEESPKGKKTEKTTIEVKAQVMDLACGKCIFKMDEAKSCQTAIKIKGKKYLAEGKDLVSASGAGLCGITGKATVSGSVKDGKFQVTAFKDFKLDEGAAEGSKKEGSDKEGTKKEPPKKEAGKKEKDDDHADDGHGH